MNVFIHMSTIYQSYEECVAHETHFQLRRSVSRWKAMPTTGMGRGPKCAQP